MESVLKYFEENYGVFECFNGCLDSFIFENETERYIDILMGMINEFYTKDIIGLKEKASKHEKIRILKDKEGKCFLEITGKNNKTIIIIRQENSNFELYKNLIGTKYTEEDFVKRLNQIQKIDYDMVQRKVPKRFLKEYSDTDLMDFLKAKLIVSYYRYLTDEYNKITIRQEFFTEPDAVMRDNSEQNVNIKERNQERINDIIDYELRKQALLKYTPFQVVQYIGRKTRGRVDVYLYEKDGFVIGICEPFFGDSYTKIFNLGETSKYNYSLIQEMLTAGLEANRVVSGNDPAIIRKAHTSVDTFISNLKTLFENLEDDKNFKEDIEKSFKVYR